MNVIAKNLKGMGKTLSYLLAGAIALAAAQFAQAKMWMGKGSDTLWSTPENWENLTVPTAEDSLAFRQENSPNKIVTIDSAFYTSGTIYVGKGSSAENPYIFEATDPSYGLTIQDDVWLGYYEGGWLWIKSGIYEFGVTNLKGMQIGRNSNDFWLKVGDGMSTASLTAKTKDVNMYAGSVLVADKATLDIASSGKSFALYNSSAAYITNSTATFGAIRLKGASSMTVSDSTIKVRYDLNVADESGANCSLSGGSSTIELINSANVFNVGNAENSSGVVTKNGGDWSCYYLRLGTGTGSTGSFTHNGGTLEVRNELSIGSKGTGTFTMNGGTVTLNSGANQFIGKDSGSSGTLNLNGGTFTARCLRRNNDGATATINFNGGTLKANFADTRGIVASGVTINVGEKGGTIDSGNKAISVGAAIGGSGAMRFKGGNSITLDGANTYTGGTVIELGTKVIASDATAKETILSNLVIDGRAVLAGGTYDVLVASGLTAADLENVTLVNCAADATVGFDNDETPTKIVVTLAEPTCLTTSYSLVFPGKTLDEIKEADFTCRFCGGAAISASCIQLDSGKGYNKKLYFNSNGILTDIYMEMQVADGDYVKCVVVQFQNSDDGVKGRIFGSNAKYVSSQSLGYVFLEPDTTTWHGNNHSIATTRTGSGYAICDLRVTAAAATVEWTLDADKNWSDFSGYDALGADDFVRITATGNYTLTMDKDVNVGKIEFMDASGSTMIVSYGKTVTTEGVSGISNILNNGIIVKTGDGTAYMPFNNTSEGVTVVNSGTMKIASHTGDGSRHIVRVKSGATFDMNGWGDTVVNVILEKGANFVNSRGNIPNNMKQTKSVTLEGDATATATKSFGLIGSGHGETALALGSNTLTLNGSDGFWLNNTTITGEGTIAVESGTLQCANRNSTGTDCTLNIGVDGTLRIDDNVSLTVKNFHNGGTVVAPFKEGANWYAQGTLEVTGTLTSGNSIPILTLANGATIKATGTAQVVSTTFSASGAIKVDASEICDAVKSAEDQRIRVLTIPKTSYKDEFKSWNIVPKDGPMLRLRWLPDGDDKMTLYVCRSIGTRIIVR